MKLMHLMRQSWLTRRGCPAPPPTLTAQVGRVYALCWGVGCGTGIGRCCRQEQPAVTVRASCLIHQGPFLSLALPLHASTATSQALCAEFSQ